MKITEAIAHLREAERKALWLVYSREHNAWWGPNHRGYFTNIESAGRYTKAEADKIVAASSYRGGSGTENHPYEVACIAPEAWAYITNPQALALIEAQAAEIEAWRAWNNSENPDAGILQVEDTGARTDSASAAFAEAAAKGTS